MSHRDLHALMRELSAAPGQGQAPFARALVIESLLQVNRGQAPFYPQEGRSLLDMMVPGIEDLDRSVLTGLHVPDSEGESTPRQQAQALWAELFGAKASRSMTTGASGAVKAGVKTLVKAAGEEGVAITSNAHVSAIDALVEVGAHGVFMPTGLNELGAPTPLDPAELLRVFRQHRIGGVAVSAPTYEGLVGGHLPTLAAIARREGAVTLADTSWGSELDLSPDLPPGPFEARCDIVVQSAHKSLPEAVSGAAVISLGPDSEVDPLVWEPAVRVEQSTSPNSVVEASLDLARHRAARFGRRDISRSIETAQAEEVRLRKGKFAQMVPERVHPKIPYRLVRKTAWTGHTGYYLARRLRKEYGLQIAMAGLGFVCYGFGPGAHEEILKANSAMEHLVGQLELGRPLGDVQPPPLLSGPFDFSRLPNRPGREVVPIEVVPIEESEDRTLAMPIGVYPPGICVGVPGRKVGAAAGFMRRQLELGARPFGQPGVPRGKIAVFVED